MNNELEAGTKLVDEAVNRLSEHFDTVRIFVTSHNGSTDTTHCFTSWRGNFYAQQAQIHEWLTRQDQAAREYAKRDLQEE